MRDIEFRGQAITGEWLYGYIVFVDDRAFILIDVAGEKYEVIPESVGQYTGLKDKNGKEDYHKNILRDTQTKLICTVEYGQHKSRVGTGFGWYLQKLSGDVYSPYPYSLEKWEIIGNIYENQKLLKGE